MERAEKIRRLLVVALMVLLLAFEVMRELYVLKVNEPVRLMGPSFVVYQEGGTVHAEGVWRRSDGGSPIVPGSVVITCVQAWGSCVEVNNSFLPDIPALHSFLEIQKVTEFGDTAITFANSAACVDYRVRIDLEQKRVFATRDRKADAPLDLCKSVENRVAMEMVDGNNLEERLDTSWTRSHFLPIYRIVTRLLRQESGEREI